MDRENDFFLRPPLESGIASEVKRNSHGLGCYRHGLYYGIFLVSLCYHIHPVAGILVEAVIISTTIAQKSLGEAAREVYEPLRDGDLPEARKKLSYIVGRDTLGLPEAEIVRGTVETVAENTSDGITAPLFGGLSGSAACPRLSGGQYM